MTCMHIAEPICPSIQETLPSGPRLVSHLRLELKGPRKEWGIRRGQVIGVITI